MTADKLCGKCKKSKPHTEEYFGTFHDGKLKKTCLNCLKKDSGKENEPEDIQDELHDPKLQGLGLVGLTEFLQAIRDVGRNDELEKVTAYITLSSLSSGHDGNIRSIADFVAKKVWGEMCYRCKYHSKYSSKRDSSTIRFMYHCAQLDQRQRKPKKKEDVKSRDKCQMDTYACHGWMHITVSSALPYLLVKVNHDVKHTPYWNHDIPHHTNRSVLIFPDFG